MRVTKTLCDACHVEITRSTSHLTRVTANGIEDACSAMCAEVLLEKEHADRQSTNIIAGRVAEKETRKR